MAKEKPPQLYKVPGVSPANELTLKQTLWPFPKDTTSLPMVLFINGIDTQFEAAKDHARYISGLAGGYNIHGVYNATHGKSVDAREYLMNRNYYATPPIRLLHNKWNVFFAHAGPDVPLMLICHSQGAVQTRNALMCYPKELRKRILVVAIAPGAFIDRDLCKDVTHYVTTLSRDLVPWLDPVGRMRTHKDVVILESLRKSPGSDHDFQSPTYEKAISTKIQDYIELYGN